MSNGFESRNRKFHKCYRSCLVILVIFIVIEFLLLHPSQSMAAPSISGVQGTVQNGNMITIQGSGFGANGPNVVIFDDFEKGTSGIDIAIGPGSAQVGGWESNSAVGWGTSIYDDTTSVSGNLSYRTWFGGSWTRAPHIRVDLPDSPDVFVSYWMFLPSGDPVPGADMADGANWKTLWLLGPGYSSGLCDQTVFTILNDSMTSFFITGNNTPYHRWVNSHMTKGNWYRIWFWRKGRTDATGQFQTWELTNSGVLTVQEDNNIQTFYSGCYVDGISVPGYGRSDSNSHPTYDDIYIATGANARARVEIGNAPSYTACTKLTITTPTLWNDTQINTTVRKGNFIIGEQAYLFIFDGAGQVNSVGYPVIIGGSGGGGIIIPHPPVLHPPR